MVKIENIIGDVVIKSILRQMYNSKLITPEEEQLIYKNYIKHINKLSK